VVKRIVLPVTDDGNDFADFDKETLAKVNQQIDKAAAIHKAGDISVREAMDYARLYEELHARAMLRTDEGITCRLTNAKYAKCIAVLKAAGART
jgi:hypothetical protein